MHDNGKPAQHPVHHRPSTVHWDINLVVGVGWSHNREGEFFLAIGSGQPLFAGDLIARILPGRVVQQGGFGHWQGGGWCLVGGRGTDEEVLSRFTPEECQVGLNVLRRESDKISHRVKLKRTQRLSNAVWVTDIRFEQPHPFGDWPEL